MGATTNRPTSHVLYRGRKPRIAVAGSPSGRPACWPVIRPRRSHRRAMRSLLPCLEVPHVPTALRLTRRSAERPPNPECPVLPGPGSRAAVGILRPFARVRLRLRRRHTSGVRDREPGRSVHHAQARACIGLSSDAQSHSEDRTSMGPERQNRHPSFARRRSPRPLRLLSMRSAHRVLQA